MGTFGLSESPRLLLSLNFGLSTYLDRSLGSANV